MVEFAFQRVININLGQAFPHPAATADFDNDGRVELIPTLFTVPGGVDLPLQILELQDDGTLVDIAPDLFRGPVPTMDFGRNIVVKDINGDGDEDLVIADHGFDADPFPGATNIVAISDGNGKLTDIGGQFETQPEFTHSVAVGDFNGDGRTDIFWGNLGVDDAFISSISNGGQVQRESFNIGPGVNAFTISLAADLDGNGIDELILGADGNIETGQRNVVADLTSGSPVVRELPVFRSLSASINESRGAIALDIETTDLNGDGLLDILIMYTGVDPFYQGFDIQALQQTQTGAFRDVTANFFDGLIFSEIGGEGAALEFLVEDFDSDGDEDILVVGAFGNDLRFFERDGNKFVGGPQFGDFGTAVAADIDGDFTPEILTIQPFVVNVYDNGIAGSPKTDTGVPLNGMLFDGERIADDVTGTRGNDSLNGGGGADSLNGLGGRDLLIGGGGKDLLIGKGGRDTLEGGGGRDTLNGGGGRDELNGGGGKDALGGGGGKDTLEGGGGKDTLDGGKGADLLTGGGGRDVFAFTSGSGRDQVLDFQDRRDKFMIDDGADAFADLRISQNGDDALVRYQGGQFLVLNTDIGDLTAADFLF